MRRAEGTPWIHSFAHGRTVYELRYDAAAVEKALDKAPRMRLPIFLSALRWPLIWTTDELERLRDLAGSRAGVGKRAINSKLKAAKQEQQRQRAKDERDRRAAERQDPRPQIPAPAGDAEWLPQMAVLNEVLGRSTTAQPPMRDIDNDASRMRALALPRLHMLNPGDIE